MVKKSLFFILISAILFLLLGALILSLNLTNTSDTLKAEVHVLNVMNVNEPQMAQETFLMAQTILIIVCISLIALIVFAKIKRKDSITIMMLFLPLSVVILLYDICLEMAGYGGSGGLFSLIVFIFFLIFVCIGGIGCYAQYDEWNTTKKCGNCHKILPRSTKVGNICLYCGVRFGEEKGEYN